MNDKMRVKMWSSMATRGSLRDRYGGAELILLVSDSNASIEEQTVVVLIPVLHVLYDRPLFSEDGTLKQ